MPRWNFGQPMTGIVQVAYTSDDIRRDMAIFTRQLGIGPWFLFEDFEFEWCRFRGKDTEIGIHLAMGFSGHMMFELIQQTCTTPSPYRETIAKRGHGFHHLARACPPDQYDAICEGYTEQGFEIALEAAVSVGGRAAYIDTTEELGGMIELIEMTPDVERLFSFMHHESRLWDGSNSVRILQPAR